MHGKEDSTVPYKTSEDLAGRFTAAGIPAKLVLISATHSHNAEAISIGKQWLQEVVLHQKR
jgi:predicted esterase